MAITLNGTTGITTPDITSTTSTLGALTQALDLGSTGQIVFPATQNASANANTLDDYEEGTWTPAISTASGWTAGSPSSVIATYTKIGNTVRLFASFVLSGSSGNVTVNDRFTMTGAPFTTANTTSGILEGSPDITVPITWLGNSLISSTTILGACLVATNSPARNTTIRISLVYEV